VACLYLKVAFPARDIEDGNHDVSIKVLQQKTLLNSVRLLYASDKDFKSFKGTIFCDVQFGTISPPFVGRIYFPLFPGSNCELAATYLFSWLSSRP
jgi:hypothetical protein